MQSKVKIRQVLFPEKAFWNDLIKFTIPIALQNLTTSLFGILDVSIISSMGEMAVSSVSIANQVSYISNNVTFGITSGASVLLSRCYGAKDREGFKKAFTIMLLLSTLLNTLITVASFCLPRQILGLYIDDRELIAQGAIYLVITAITNVFYGISSSIVSFFRSVKLPSIPLYAALGTVAVKTTLNVFLIYGIGPVPAMGIAGAAIATLLAKTVELLIYLFFLMRFKEKEYCFALQDLQRLNKGEVKGFIRETAPVIINESMWVIGQSSFQMIFGRMGVTAVSAVSVARQLENFCNSFFYGIGIGGCVSISTMLGAKQYEEAKLAARRYALAGFEMGVFIMLLMLGINRIYVTTFFSDLTSETQLVTRELIAVYALYMPFRSMASAMIMGSLRGGGDAVKAMFYDVLPIYVWSLPLGFLLAMVFHLPITVVLAVMQFKRVIKCGFAFRRMLSDQWIKV